MVIISTMAIEVSIQAVSPEFGVQFSRLRRRRPAARPAAAAVAAAGGAASGAGACAKDE